MSSATSRRSVPDPSSLGGVRKSRVAKIGRLSAARQKALFESSATQFRQLQTEVGKFIVGLEGVVEQLLIGLLCGGNVLLEGVPGIGKTCLVPFSAGCCGVNRHRRAGMGPHCPANRGGRQARGPAR